MLHHNGPDISTSDAYMARTGLHHERESNSSIRMLANGLGNCKQTICLSWLSKVWETVSQVSRMEVSVMDNLEMVCRNAARQSS